MGRELQNAASAAWSLGTGALNTCENNPELCKAGIDLWNTTLETSATLAGEVQNRWENPPKPPLKTAEVEPRAIKKIQARVE